MWHGCIVIDKGKFNGKTGHSKFIKRSIASVKD
jgi:hypothetical protein